MSEDNSLELEDEELEGASGGKQARQASVEPGDLGARTRLAGGQRGGRMRRVGDVEIGEAEA